MAEGCGITADLFEQVAREYRVRCGLGLVATFPNGEPVHGSCRCQEPGEDCRRVRNLAIRETLRWGDPTIESCPNGHFIWAVPLMQNRTLLGGLIASIPEQRFLPHYRKAEPFDVRKACSVLRQLTEARDLTNADYLESRRHESQQERVRAEQIHLLKMKPRYTLRTSYLQEEPVLLAAVRKGDVVQARESLARLVNSVFYLAGEHLDLAKSYLMELTIVLCRTAIEAGGHAEELLGANYRHIVELSRLQERRDLGPWIEGRLEDILSLLSRPLKRSIASSVAAAVEYIREHYSEQITRSEVSRAVGMSVAHFSRQFHRDVGRSYVDFLTQTRVDRAAEALYRTTKPLVLVALDSGFQSQSYFSRVFRRYTGLTPLEYRKQRLQDPALSLAK